MTQTKYVQGAGGGGKGGGGGGSRTPTEADDTLQSIQFANVLDLISEGEIQGLDDGNKSIFLDNTPVQNADGSNNFSGYTVATRNGTQSQNHIPGDFGSTQVERPVNVEVTNGSSVTRNVTGTEVDRLRVTLTIPSLQRIEDDGDIVGHSVQIKIQIQYDGGGFNDVVTDTISGKSSNRYQRDYMITLSSSTNVQVRMIRVSADETSSKIGSTTIFQSFTEIVDEKFSYPNSALVALRFDSREFQSIPSRKYLIRGIKVKIPSNATVDTTTHIGRITYSGVWDGTFQAATWCNDPAWCLYDLLISDRYGASVPELTLDKYDFLGVSQYCNELVDDGKGGQEPRFSLNILLNSRDEVYNVIQEMTAIFRGIAYYGAGSLVLNQDKPTDSSYALGPSNVIDGLFTYAGTSQKARHTVATVAYQNYDTQGDTEFEYVEDHDAVAKYGIINKDIKAIGCYSQGQAHRIGKWTLLSEQNLTETCQFAVGIESGIVLRPGQVVDIADPVRAGVRRSGRVRSATTTQLTVDSSTNLSVSLATSDNDPKVSVMLPSGIAETRNIPAGGIQPQANGTATIDVTSAFSQTPTAGSVFLVQTSDVQSQQFRIVSVTETEEGVYGVSAAAYNASIYDAVESDNELTTRDITNLSAVPNPVSAIAVEEFLYETGQGVFVGASVSWEHDRVNISEFRVQYRVDDDNFETLTTASPSITIRDIRAGTLHVQIQARNYLNRGSIITTNSFTIAGKTAPPQLDNSEFLADGTTANPNYISFDMIPVNGQAKLTWRQSLDLDVRNGGHVRLRHSPNTSNVTWSNSTSISEEIAGSATEAYADLKGGTYSMKFIDSGGRESQNFALIEYVKPELESTEEVSSLSATEDPTFPGNKTNLHVEQGWQLATRKYLACSLVLPRHKPD
jgi:predicted phage tail protein